MPSLVLSEIFPPRIGGSGRYLWELYRRLPREDFVIAAGEAEGQESFDAGHDLSVHRLDLELTTRFLRPSSLPTYRAAWRRLRRLAREREIGWVHASRAVPEGLLALLLKWSSGVPYLVYVHGEEVNPSNTSETPSWTRRRVYESRELGLMVGLVLRNASLLVASSHNARDILQHRWRLPEGRIRLLHPGVDTEVFVPAASGEVAPPRLGWQGRSVILTVGRLQRRKGYDTMIRALPSILERVPGALYAIVGSGEERQELEHLVASLELGDRVRFLGDLTDAELVACYQHCDLFALPNRRIGGDIEGIGLVLIEAQACGRPVLAGDSGGTRETMRIPATGLVVNCDDIEPLASEVSDLLLDTERRRAMGSAAREWAVTQFDWRARAREAASIFAAAGTASGIARERRGAEG